jgi:hypothetical protein
MRASPYLEVSLLPDKLRIGWGTCNRCCRINFQLSPTYLAYIQSQKMSDIVNVYSSPIDFIILLSIDHLTNLIIV